MGERVKLVGIVVEGAPKASPAMEAGPARAAFCRCEFEEGIEGSAPGKKDLVEEEGPLAMPVALSVRGGDGHAQRRREQRGVEIGGQLRLAAVNAGTKVKLLGGALRGGDRSGTVSGKTTARSWRVVGEVAMQRRCRRRRCAKKVLRKASGLVMCGGC